MSLSKSPGLPHPAPSAEASQRQCKGCRDPQRNGKLGYDVETRRVDDVVGVHATSGQVGSRPWDRHKGDVEIAVQGTARGPQAPLKGNLN